MRIFRPAILFFFTLTACAPALYRPNGADSAWLEEHAPGVTLEQLNRGRALYVATCAGCHRLRLPERYAADRWPDLVASMDRTLHLDPEEKALIVNYLTTASTRLRSEQ